MKNPYGAPAQHSRYDHLLCFALLCFALLYCAQVIRRHHSPLSGGRVQSLRRGVSGMDAARGLGVPAIKGHGWPLYAGPRSGDGTREVERSEPGTPSPDGGASVFAYFFPGRAGATGKSGSPSRAKLSFQAARKWLCDLSVHPSNPAIAAVTSSNQSKDQRKRGAACANTPLQRSPASRSIVPDTRRLHGTAPDFQRRLVRLWRA